MALTPFSDSIAPLNNDDNDDDDDDDDSLSSEVSVKVQLLTTRQAAWYIISVVSVCLSVCQTFKRPNMKVNNRMSGISRGNKYFLQCKTSIDNNSGSI